MSFIYDNLELGEIVAYQAKVSPFAYVSSLAYMCLMMMPGKMTALLTTQLALTGKRVVGKVGLIRRRHITWPHGKVEVIRVKRGMFGALFNYGTVTFISKDGGRVKFYGIARPFELQQKEEEFIELALLGRVLPGADALPEMFEIDKAIKPAPTLEAASPPPPPATPAAPAVQPVMPAASVSKPALPEGKTFGRRGKTDDTTW